MFVDLLGGLGFKTTFERLYIDADRIAGQGRINYVSRGVAAMEQTQPANQKTRKDIRSLAEAMASTDPASVPVSTLLEWADVVKGWQQAVISETLVLTADEKGQLLSAKQTITTAAETIRTSSVATDKTSAEQTLRKTFADNKAVIQKLGEGVGKGLLVKLGLDELFTSLKNAIARRDTAALHQSLREFEPELQAFFKANPQIDESSRQQLAGQITQLKADAEGLLADTGDDPQRWAWLENTRRKAENLYNAYRQLLKAAENWAASYPCVNQGLQKAKADFAYRDNNGGDNYLLSTMAGLVESGRCLTVKDPGGSDTKNFGLGFANALIMQVDLFSLDIEISKLLKDEKNWQMLWDLIVRQYSCYRQMPSLTLALTGRAQIEQLLQHLECTSGLSREEMLQISALVYTFIEAHIGDAYFYGQVAGVLVTLPLIIKKIPALMRLLRVDQLLQALNRYVRLSGENLTKLRGWLETILRGGRSSQALKPLNLASFRAWVNNLPTLRSLGVVRPANIQYEYQIRVIGSADEYRVVLNNPPQGLSRNTIDIDGVDFNTASIIDAKFIDNAARSPYIPTSACPDFVRTNVINQLDDELRRIKAVIDDATTPARDLRIITNNQDAANFFRQKLQELDIIGDVTVNP